jgi:hypothetical protein
MQSALDRCLAGTAFTQSERAAMAFDAELGDIVTIEPVYYPDPVGAAKEGDGPHYTIRDIVDAETAEESENTSGNSYMSQMSSANFVKHGVPHLVRGARAAVMSPLPLGGGSRRRSGISPLPVRKLLP